MEIIRGRNISFKFDDQVDDLLEGISFSLDERKKVGLIGDNGSGKTTLLHVIRGVLPLDRGELTIRKGTTVAFLPQEVSFGAEARIRDFLWQARGEVCESRKRLDALDESSPAYADAVNEYYAGGGDAFEALVEKILAGFGIDHGRLADPIVSLSGGEKTKIALARILLCDPDVMLLDEPTNHLEIESLAWLEEHLRAGDVPYIIVSHDRRFLDNCVNEIWELHNKSLRMYSGNYSFYKITREREFARQQRQYETQHKKIEQLQAAARQRRQDADRMEKFKFSRSVTKRGGICKRDDGSGKGSVRMTAGMRAARAVERRIQRMMEKERADKPFAEKDRRISFSAQPLSGKFILRVENLGMRFDSRYVFRNVTFAVRVGVKIGIIGRNGSGKTTLLKIITANLSGYDGAYCWSPQVKIGYYSQEHETLDMTHTILQEVLQGNYQDQTRARTILGRLNIRGDKVNQAVGTLSLGERSKTALAKILFSDANILVLDEPTNHIELSAREAFEEALGEYDGAVLIASHDRYLLDRITDEIFDIENNRYFAGTYGQYLSGPADVPPVDDVADVS